MKSLAITQLFLITLSGVAHAAGEPGTGLKPNLEMAAAWNDFADKTVALHKQVIAGRRVTETVEVDRYGGEMGKAYTYREVTYQDADTGKILSRVRTNAKDRNELQMAEVYVYDEQGRVMRDYAFIYLPWARGAPIRTFANLHYYPDGLHAWRQFDASGRRTYEHCEGHYGGQPVKLSISEEQLGDEHENTDRYRACFAGLTRTAGALLTPH